jgi:hypothetical protein
VLLSFDDPFVGVPSAEEDWPNLSRSEPQEEYEGPYVPTDKETTDALRRSPCSCFDTWNDEGKIVA